MILLQSIIRGRQTGIAFENVHTINSTGYGVKIENLGCSWTDGRIIRLGDLGSLRITLSSEGKAMPEEVTAAAVKKTDVIFTPGKKLQEMLHNARFTKI